MGPFDSFFFEEHKYHIIGGIAGIFMLIIVLALVFRAEKKPDSSESKSSEEYRSETLYDIENNNKFQNDTLVDSVKLLRFYDGDLNQVYIITLDTDINGVEHRSIYRNYGYYGESSYNYTRDEYIDHEFITIGDTFGSSEEDAPEPESKLISIENIEDKAIESGLVYRVTTEDAIKVINNLIQEGYNLHYKISTSDYTDVYLEDLTALNTGLRVIFREEEDILIISEISDMSSIDIDTILQTKLTEEYNENQN